MNVGEELNKKMGESKHLQRLLNSKAISNNNPDLATIVEIAYGLGYADGGYDAAKKLNEVLEKL